MNSGIVLAPAIQGVARGPSGLRGQAGQAAAGRSAAGYSPERETMGEKLRVGVIGVGTFGAKHARVYAQLDACTLQAVADVDARRAEAVSAGLHVTGYSDYRELLERADLDAVSICTPDGLHVAPAVAAAQAGKHILVEKPLALTPTDCDAILAAAEAAGVTLMVGQILRFDPRYVAAQAAIRSGRVGELVHMAVRRNNGLGSARRLAALTSVLFFLGVHDIDFLNWCAGAPAVSVYGQSVSRVLRDTPDTVQALLRYPGGATASLEASWVLPDSMPLGLDASFEGVGTTGAVYVNGGSYNVSVAAARFEQPELFYAPDVQGTTSGALRDELEHFAHCVLRGATPLVGGSQGKAAVQVAWAIQRSLETGAVVEVA
jgi:predicted dehydrogenase